LGNWGESEENGGVEFGKKGQKWAKRGRFWQKRGEFWVRKKTGKKFKIFLKKLIKMLDLCMFIW
jgi:hypothetical protein